MADRMTDRPDRLEVFRGTRYKDWKTYRWKNKRYRNMCGRNDRLNGSQRWQIRIHLTGMKVKSSRRMNGFKMKVCCSRQD